MKLLMFFFLFFNTETTCSFTWVLFDVLFMTFEWLYLKKSPDTMGMEYYLLISFKNIKGGGGESKKPTISLSFWKSSFLNVLKELLIPRMWNHLALIKTSVLFIYDFLKCHLGWTMNFTFAHILFWNYGYDDVSLN